MNIKINILNSTNKLTSVYDFLEERIDFTVDKVKTHFDYGPIDITVAPFHKGKAPSSGIGGYANSPHRVEILLDGERSDLKSIIESELIDVLSHELHHSIRIGFDLPVETLGEHLILEGLACHFEHTITNGKQSSLFTKFENCDWKQLFDTMRPFLNKKEFPFNKFFHGSEPDVYPNYAGYWVGFNLIADYVARTGASDSSMVGLEAHEFLRNNV